MPMKEITPSTQIEEIVEMGPELVLYLSKQGIRCIRCGEPIWGTLEEAAMEKGFNEAEIQNFVRDMNQILKKR